jgi:pathogenesis-related protein 1
MFGRASCRVSAAAVFVAVVLVAVAGCSSAAQHKAASSSAAAAHFSLVPPLSRSASSGQTAKSVFGDANLPPSTLSQADVDATLAAHNDWRARYKVPALTWDPALASFAQDWANQIAASENFDHRPNNQYGENIFWGSADSYTPASVVNGWGGEVADYDAAANSCAEGKACGHYTQLVWSTTTAVGCGKATDSTGAVNWVCNYNPPGNFDGQSPFAPS